MMSSYSSVNLYFKKTNYDWFSIPFTNKINFSQRNEFKVRNIGVKDDCFLVGLIKAEAIKKNIRMPWKTDQVICF